MEILMYKHQRTDYNSGSYFVRDLNPNPEMHLH